MNRVTCSIDWETFQNMKERISLLEIKNRQLEKDNYVGSELWLKFHSLLNRLATVREMIDECVADSSVRNRLKGVLTIRENE